jgi:crotonobetainyl-CoA:carnitine CoA-transferase CaiB-like acyl-CoA transferase
MLANLGANYLVNVSSQAPPGRMGNAHVNIVPYQVFEVAANAQGARDFLIVAVGNDGQFAKLCECLGKAEWALDSRFVRNQDRVRHRDVLIPMIADQLMTQGKQHWLSLLEAAKVPCGPINNLAEVFADPHVMHRQMVQQWQHPLQADLSLVASPIKMSETPVRQSMPPPLLGQHHKQVLQDWLGRETDSSE